MAADAEPSERRPAPRARHHSEPVADDSAPALISRQSKRSDGRPTRQLVAARRIVRTSGAILAPHHTLHAPVADPIRASRRPGTTDGQLEPNETGGRLIAVTGT